MTKKLKKRVNRIAYTILGIIASIVTILCLNAEVFVMPMNIEDLEKTGVSETVDTKTASEGNEAKALSAGSVVECESIVQGARDNNLSDGNYIFRVTGTDTEGNSETIDYPVEIMNYYDNVTYSVDSEETKTVSLGDRSQEYKMLIVKYHKNLTIDKGITLTANTALDAEGNETNLTYKKGMYLCVIGELTNNGNISMTARGTYNQEGENVYLWKNKGENKEQDFEYVPAVGGQGGAGLTTTKNQFKNGTTGGNGSLRATGGGGAGASSAGDGTPTVYSGSGSTRNIIFRRFWRWRS